MEATDSTFIVDILEPCRRHFKVSWIGQTIRTDRSQVWQFEMIIINFQNVSTRWFAIRQIHSEFYSLLNDADLIWRNSHATEFRFDVQCSFLWHYKGEVFEKRFPRKLAQFLRTNQEVSITIVECGLIHWLIAQINMNGDSMSWSRIAGTTNRM